VRFAKKLRGFFETVRTRLDELAGAINILATIFRTETHLVFSRFLTRTAPCF
jgi:hypothetical protein